MNVYSVFVMKGGASLGTNVKADTEAEAIAEGRVRFAEFLSYSRTDAEAQAAAAFAQASYLREAR